MENEKNDSFFKDAIYKKAIGNQRLEPIECEWLAYYESLLSREDSDHPKGSDPFVGAVVQRPDKTVWGWAHRANGQEGHHAEYSLIMEKLAGQNLAGCALYVTLEPCVSDARNSESCSEIIAKSSIKDIYVGILDPDASVYSKGLSFLFEHGLCVHPFASEIQEKIISSCDAFREKRSQETRLFQRVVKEVIRREFDAAAVSFFITHAKHCHSEEDLARLLVDKGFAVIDHSGIKVDREVKLMFTKEERNEFPSRTIFFEDTTPPEKPADEFRGPVMLALIKFNSFLRSFGISEGNENYLLLKEAFVNALIHRDYFGDNSYIYVTYDGVKLTIKNPMPKTFSETKKTEICNFDTEPCPVNPILAFFAHEVGFIDIEGHGLKSLGGSSPKPQISIKSDNILVLSIMVVSH